MATTSSASTNSPIWQTRLSREAAATYEEDLKILGIDRSEALRRGLRLVHRQALEMRMAGDVEQFYGGDRAPLSEVTAGIYGQEAFDQDEGADGGNTAPR